LCKPGPTKRACGLAACIYVYMYILATWVRLESTWRWPGMPGVLPWAKRSVALADTWAKKGELLLPVLVSRTYRLLSYHCYLLTPLSLRDISGIQHHIALGLYSLALNMGAQSGHLHTQILACHWR